MPCAPFTATENFEWLRTKPQGWLSSEYICISSFVSGFLGPINREMRHLISSLQNHNLQLKGDVQRYKRKLRETQMEINKVDDVIHRQVFSVFHSEFWAKQNFL